MVTEGREVEDPQDNEGNDAGINQQAEHQPLVHEGENLPSLPDKSEPLGPWRDESGRRCVHRPGCKSLDGLETDLDECLSGSGASGSTFARRTGFVTGFALASAGLSTVFAGWAAARP